MVKDKVHFFNLSLHHVDSCHFISLWLYEGCHIWSCFGIDSLEGVTWSTSHCIINFYIWSPCHFMSWFNRDWHLVLCDSSWIACFLRLNINLPFSITYGSLTPRLPPALLWCIIHRGHVLVNSSSTTILSHTTPHVFHRLILENFLLWSSCFHRYWILRCSTWTILPWSRSSHKCWTKLIFNFFLFICFSCLTWHRFFNMGLYMFNT
jgi:hypothetical protein